MEPVSYLHVRDIPDKILRKDCSLYEEVMGLGTCKITENAYSQNVARKFNSEAIIDFT